MKRLPKTFAGAPILRGKSLDGFAFHRLCIRAADLFPQHNYYVVVSNDPQDLGSSESLVFKNKVDAIKYARALSYGNVDHRVLHVKDHILVIATKNELEDCE